MKKRARTSANKVAVLPASLCLNIDPDFVSRGVQCTHSLAVANRTERRRARVGRP